jgi:hypothetical protein
LTIGLANVFIAEKYVPHSPSTKVTVSPPRLPHIPPQLHHKSTTPKRQYPAKHTIPPAHIFLQNNAEIPGPNHRKKSHATVPQKSHALPQANSPAAI